MSKWMAKGAKGRAVYALASHIRHSCEPNVQAKYIEGTSRVSFVALRAISAGEEITCSYLHFSDNVPVQDRLSKLKRYYGFECCCSKCSYEKD